MNNDFKKPVIVRNVIAAVKNLFLKMQSTDSIYQQVEKDIEANKHKFHKYVYRRKPDYVRFANSKKRNPNVRKFIPHTRLINEAESLEDYLGNDELWDILIDWKGLLGENIYLKRHKNKNG